LGYQFAGGVMAFACQWEDGSGRVCGAYTKLSFAKAMFPPLDRDLVYYCPVHEEAFRAEHGFEPVKKS
jgi:hypothetical protein